MYFPLYIFYTETFLIKIKPKNPRINVAVQPPIE